MGQVGGLALAQLLHQRVPLGGHGQQRGAAILRVGGALHHAELLEPRDEPRRGRPLHALALGELGRRQRAVAVDRRERRGQRRAQPAARPPGAGGARSA